MRGTAHQALTKRAVQNYRPIQTKEATILTLSLVSPSARVNLLVDLPKHFHRAGASTIMSIVYDYPTLESIDDPAVKNIEDFMLRVSNAMTPGRYLVDIFPWMMYIPERSGILLIISTCIMLTYNPQKVREMEARRLETIFPGL